MLWRAGCRRLCLVCCCVPADLVCARVHAYVCVPCKEEFFTILELSWSKWKFPEMSTDPGIAWIACSILELICVWGWNFAHCRNFTLFPKLFDMHAMTMAVSVNVLWWGKCQASCSSFLGSFEGGWLVKNKNKDWLALDQAALIGFHQCLLF